MIDRLTSRAVIGSFYKALHQNTGAKWMPGIAMPFNSDQASEEYAWLGQSPVMREWVGGRHAKGFSENSIIVKNLHFEATVEILVRHLRRDKSGQALVRIRDLAMRTNSHVAALLSTLMTGGKDTACYDDEFFYDTDHQEGNNTTNQSNDISYDVTTVATPTVSEAQLAMMQSVAQILSFKDNENEPMNEDAQNFLVMVPTAYYITFAKALTLPKGTDITEQHIPNEFNISVVANPRLSTAEEFHTFRTDGEVKPFIIQNETPVKLSAKAEGSEFEFDNDAHQYGVDVWRNVAYAYWQHACLTTLT